MNTNNAIVLGVSALLAAYVVAMFRILPGERWQVFAAMPVEKRGEGLWRGLNLTYYGVFNGTSYALSVAVLVTLMSALGVPLLGTLGVTVIMLAICVPASRIVARIVEKRRHTITVGGAVFVGALTSPFVISGLNTALGPRLGFEVPLIPMLAAIVCAYMVGEGTGRLACASFGCCYGKPVARCSPTAQRIFSRWNFTFHGPTKKAVYEGRHRGVPLVPIQEVTALLLTVGGGLAALLFINGYPRASLIAGVAFSQGWRFLSEFIRSDYRGKARVSAYQLMALSVIAGAVALSLVLGPVPQSPVQPDMLRGLEALWSPGMLLFLQGVWVATFLWTGLSSVTRSQVKLEVAFEKLPASCQPIPSEAATPDRIAAVPPANAPAMAAADQGLTPAAPCCAAPRVEAPQFETTQAGAPEPQAPQPPARPAIA